MKKTIISLLLTTAIISLTFFNVFACEDTGPYVIINDPVLITTDY